MQMMIQILVRTSLTLVLMMITLTRPGGDCTRKQGRKLRSSKKLSALPAGELQSFKAQAYQLQSSDTRSSKLRHVSFKAQAYQLQSSAISASKLNHINSKSQTCELQSSNWHWANNSSKHKWATSRWTAESEILCPMIKILYHSLTIAYSGYDESEPKFNPESSDQRLVPQPRASPPLPPNSSQLFVRRTNLCNNYSH